MLRFIMKPRVNYVRLMHRRGADIWETIVSCHLCLVAHHLILDSRDAHFLRVSVEVGCVLPCSPPPPFILPLTHTRKHIDIPTPSLAPSPTHPHTGSSCAGASMAHVQSLGGKGAILLISLRSLRNDPLFFRMHSAAMDLRRAMEALKASGMAARMCVCVWERV
jgi:hypothetical protein